MDNHGGYVIEWQTTETVSHQALVSVDRMASMLGVDVQEVLSTPIAELESLGRRGLANGLADIEDGDTETGLDELTREDIEVRLATDVPGTDSMTVH